MENAERLVASHLRTRQAQHKSKPQYMTNSSVLEYELFAADKHPPPEAIARISGAAGNAEARAAKRAGNTSDWRLRYLFPREDLTANRYHWTLDQPAVICRRFYRQG